MSEKRLIDARHLFQDIVDQIKTYKSAPHNSMLRNRIKGLDVARLMVDEAPTIEAVEVVRCACCISFMEYTAEDTQAAEGADGDCFIRINFSDYPDYYAVKKDDYCSYGTRKEAAYE